MSPESTASITRERLIDFLNEDPICEMTVAFLDEHIAKKLV